MSINRGRTEPCKNTLSGVKNVYLWKWQPYSLAQIKGVRGVNLTQYPNTAIFKYPTLSDSNTYDENLGEDSGYNQSLSVTLKKIDLESNQDLSKYQNLILGAIVEDYNGLFRLMGAFNGVELTDLNVSVGSGRADFNGYKLTLESRERFKAPLFTNLNDVGLYIDIINAPFIIEVDTSKAGSANDQFQFTGAVGDYDVIAKQGGTVVQTFNNLSNDATLTFANGVGIYTLEVKRKDTNGFERIRFNNSGDKLKIIDIKQWGSVDWSDFVLSFFGCLNNTFTASDSPKLENVLDVREMFGGATSATPNTTNWNVGNIVNMSNFFKGATAANPNVLSWNVGNVTNMIGLFFNATSATPNTTNWDVSSVTSMMQMFIGATSANPDTTNWNVSNVTSMQQMFNTATSANPDVSNWDVSNVTNMILMFRDATSATPNTTNWDVSSVNNMSQMFRGATSANPDTTNWNVSSVTNMSLMFFNATSANPNMRNWNVSSVTNMSNMLNGANLSTNNLDGCYTNWSQLSLQQNVSFHAGTTKFSAAAQAGRDILVNTYNWTITDGGLV